MDLSVKKDVRNITNAFHKSRGLDATKVKLIAMKDITKECGNGKFYTKSYISMEGKILQWSKFNLTTRTLRLEQY